MCAREYMLNIYLRNHKMESVKVHYERHAKICMRIC